MKHDTRPFDSSVALTLPELMRVAWVRTIPVMIGYIPIGVVFGVMLSVSGHPPLLALLMSLFIYSGANQFAALQFLAENTYLLEICLVTLALSMRHFFYGLSLADVFAGAGWRKPYLIAGLTDETYALIAADKKNTMAQRHTIWLCMTAFNHCYWIAGGLVGAIAGSFIPLKLRGLEFALTALFIVLAVDQYKSSRNPRPFALALIIGVLALVFVPKTLMLFSALSAGLVLLFVLPQQKAAPK